MHFKFRGARPNHSRTLSRVTPCCSCRRVSRSVTPLLVIMRSAKKSISEQDGIRYFFKMDFLHKDLEAV